MAGPHSRLCQSTLLGERTLTDEVLVGMTRQHVGRESLHPEKVQIMKLLLARSEKTRSRFHIALLASALGVDMVAQYTGWHKSKINDAVSGTRSDIEDRQHLLRD